MRKAAGTGSDSPRTAQFPVPIMQRERCIEVPRAARWQRRRQRIAAGIGLDATVFVTLARPFHVAGGSARRDEPEVAGVVFPPASLRRFEFDLNAVLQRDPFLFAFLHGKSAAVFAAAAVVPPSQHQVPPGGLDLGAALERHHSRLTIDVGDLQQRINSVVQDSVLIGQLHPVVYGEAETVISTEIDELHRH